MPKWKPKYAWERYPEYIAAQQYARFLGRILASLPPRVRLKAARTMMRGATHIAQGIAGAHAELPPDAEWTHAERAAFHDMALEAVDASRCGLNVLKEAGVGSRPDIGAALELLERVEAGLKERALPV